MKMKNMLIGGMSLALVACISVGGTLAYLQNTTNEVTNTFVMENGTTIHLWETAAAVTSGEYKQAVTDGVAGTEAIVGTGDKDERQGTDEGIVYTDVLPGAEINKEPRLLLENGPESYVYALVETEAVAGKQDIIYNLSDWTLVPGTSNLYRYNSTVTPGEETGWTTEIFDTINIDETATASDLKAIEITGFAIQAKGLAGEDVDEQMATADAQAIKALS